MSPAPDPATPEGRQPLPVRRIVFGLIAAGLLVFLAFRQPPQADVDPGKVIHEFAALGTWNTITVWTGDETRNAAAREAMAAVEAQLLAYTGQWRPDGDGALARLNAELAAGDSITVPAGLESLFSSAEAVRTLSGGRFDARIGALVALWGFDREEHFRSAPPAATEVAAMVAALAHAPEWRPGLAYGPAPAVRWTFGAIAKGDAVRHAYEQLAAAGFDQALISAGGDLYAAGTHGERDWRLGIRHPRAMGQQVLAFIDSRHEGEAVFTSGDYERFFLHDGERYHHILDPATGQPARGLISVTVVHPDARYADAATTALFVAGDGWRELARAMALDTVLVVRADGDIEMTPRAGERFRLADGLTATIRP